jgi:hypothetical protein
MTTETMNVHQALCELKTLDRRIEKAIQTPEWVATNKHSNVKIDGVAIKEWEADVKAKYQKAMDLIRRRDAIKRAVVNSNAVTKVLVAGVEYTVAEAIDKKNHGTQFLSMMARRLAHDHAQAKMIAERENGSRLEDRADVYVKSLIGNTDTKGMTDEIKKRRDDFIAAQTMDILDPIGALKEVERLEDEVSAFLTNVDAALSVSNAVTNIVVEY